MKGIESLVRELTRIKEIERAPKIWIGKHPPENPDNYSVILIDDISERIEESSVNTTIKGCVEL